MCEICVKAIHKKRLKAIPHARMCIACQRDEEHTE
jgi:RNA polymerase-binding transcription factor DksA